MKRITTLLRESDAVEVRNAVCAAGAKLVLFTQVPQPQRTADPWQWRGGYSAEAEQMHVRLEVIVDDSLSGRIVAAIKETSHSGRVILAFNHGNSSRCVAN